jgi:YHS domain-containing protein
MSEAEADKKLDPFTGLTLEDDATAAASKPVVADTANPPKEVVAIDEDPFADELRKMGVLPAEPEQKKPEPQAEPAKQVALAPAPASDTPTFDGIEDQSTREKMKKIHERGSMKGLKGFCPVTLRDHRELVDAKPDFHSTYRGQKFHFADADAKLTFDEDPSRYAPAAYGADVVALTRDKDVVEGSLDFAAWFKGRLYLFGTQEAHDTFVADPTQFATPVGIE